MAVDCTADQRSWRLDESEHKALTSIRGIAALWVTASHLAEPLQKLLPLSAFHAMSVGYMAVDIFFVLSGFILALVYRNLNTDQIAFFAFKRLARVYPLNILLTTVMVAFAAIGFPPGQWQYWPLLPWFYSMMESFIPTPVVAWIVTSWSVGIEVICYLSFPIMLIGARRLPAGLQWMALALVFGFEFWVQSHYLAYFLGFGALLRGFGGFALGAVLGIVAPRMPRPGKWACSALELACVAGIGAAVTVMRLKFIPLASAGLILLLYFDQGLIAALLRGRLWFWQGRISYSVYLLHGPLLADWLGYSARFGVWGCNPFVLALHMPSWAAALLSCLAFVGGVSLIATVTWRYVEQPGRHLARLIPRRGMLYSPIG